jgi:fermentation-respiration switch protein FrsA (DUF1100 family)
MDEEGDDGDVAIGTTVQGSTRGDVDPKLPAPTSTYLHLPAPTYSNQQAAPTAEATNMQQAAPTDNVIQPKPALKEELPGAK